MAPSQQLQLTILLHRLLISFVGGEHSDGKIAGRHHGGGSAGGGVNVGGGNGGRSDGGGQAATVAVVTWQWQGQPQPRHIPIEVATASKGAGMQQRTVISWWPATWLMEKRALRAFSKHCLERAMKSTDIRLASDLEASLYLPSSPLEGEACVGREVNRIE
jgi:hypothetical protein